MSFDMCFFYWYGRYCLQSKVCKQIEIGKEENIVYNKRKKNYSQIYQGPLKQDSYRVFLLKAEFIAWGFAAFLPFPVNLEYTEIWNRIDWDMLYFFV